MKKKMRLDEREAGVMPQSRGEQEGSMYHEGLGPRQEHSRSALEMVEEHNPQPIHG